MVNIKQPRLDDMTSTNIVLKLNLIIESWYNDLCSGWILIIFSAVPPKIDDELSSSDIIVKEGDTVTLVCNATGVPMPEINWWRSTFPQTTHNRVTTKDSRTPSVFYSMHSLITLGTIFYFSMFSTAIWSCLWFSCVFTFYIASWDGNVWLLVRASFLMLAW